MKKSTPKKRSPRKTYMTLLSHEHNSSADCPIYFSRDVTTHSYLFNELSNIFFWFTVTLKGFFSFNLQRGKQNHFNQIRSNVQLSLAYWLKIWFHRRNYRKDLVSWNSIMEATWLWMRRKLSFQIELLTMEQDFIRRPAWYRQRNGLSCKQSAEKLDLQLLLHMNLRKTRLNPE